MRRGEEMQLKAQSTIVTPHHNFPTLLSFHLNHSAHLYPVVSAPDYQTVSVSSLSTSAYFYYQPDCLACFKICWLPFWILSIISWIICLSVSYHEDSVVASLSQFAFFNRQLQLNLLLGLNFHWDLTHWDLYFVNNCAIVAFLLVIFRIFRSTVQCLHALKHSVYSKAWVVLTIAHLL